jgi:hypothetical protein
MAFRDHCRCATRIAIIWALAFGARSPLTAASAVAIAIDQKTGKWNYGYWQGGTSESEVKDRAIRACIAMGGINPKVLASTSRRGYGAIVIFETTDKRPRFAVSLGAGTEQLAIKEALQKAKAAGGRYARVMKTWNDATLRSAPEVIKL